MGDILASLISRYNGGGFLPRLAIRPRPLSGQYVGIDHPVDRLSGLVRPSPSLESGVDQARWGPGSGRHSRERVSERMSEGRGLWESAVLEGDTWERGCLIEGRGLWELVVLKKGTRAVSQRDEVSENQSF